jgi:hypothetical protein
MTSSPSKKNVKVWAKSTAPLPKTVTELHKLQIETMMKNIDKPIRIQKILPKNLSFSEPKEFFRNVSGSC